MFSAECLIDFVVYIVSVGEKTFVNPLKGEKAVVSITYTI